ncbi:MAG: DUF4198 domain-containing protein [Bryobacterales bacterium]|nr:DUF4198 domain-containing protein [Bryobacterales bacterium]
MRFWMFLFSLPVLAHTLYFLPAKFRAMRGEKLVFSVHNGDSFPASEQAVAAERLLDARLMTPSGLTVPLTDFQKLGNATHAVTPALAEAGTHWLLVRTRPNYLSLDPMKFESYLKDEGLEHVIEWRRTHGEAAKASRERYTKHAKSLIVSEQPSAAWENAYGLDLEFILRANPSMLKPGDSLPVWVRWKGKPAAGLRVEQAWATANEHGMKIAGRTDAEGKVTVTLDRAARWRLHTVAMERITDDPQADWSSDWATLTFELGNPAVTNFSSTK